MSEESYMVEECGYMPDECCYMVKDYRFIAKEYYYMPLTAWITQINFRKCQQSLAKNQIFLLFVWKDGSLSKRLVSEQVSLTWIIKIINKI